MYHEHEVIEMLEQAFEKGKEWHDTYHTWFTPSSRQHTAERKKAARQVLKAHPSHKTQIKKPSPSPQRTRSGAG